jgi:hypothetical protein
MVACGGTSNDDDAKSSADLKVDPNFELKSTGLLKLDVDLASLANERAYLYVCQRKDTTTLNYDRCLVKTPISEGQYSGTFTLGNDTETLGLEVWTYNPDDEPVQYSWARSKDGMSWNVSS